MTINPYKRYSNASADWFDLIPDHWSRIRLRNIVNIRKIIAGTTDYEILSITQRGIKVKDIESNEGQLSMDYSKYQIVEPGDFAMNHMDLLTGYVDLSCQKGVTSPDYRVFRIKEDAKMNAIFLLRVLQNAYTQKVLYAYGQGSSKLGRWRLPTDGFKNFEIPNPPLEEQEQIATFIDHETAKIDALIAEQERLIELLQEKRQAVISHSVTKGLNPNAPMKDSGVEWLGEVPEHWEITKLSYLISTRKGIAFKSEDFCDEGIPVSKASDIKGLTLREASTYISDEFANKFPKAIIYEGEIIISTVGSNPEVKNSAAGQLCTVPVHAAGNLLNQNTAVFSPLPNKIHNKFLFFSLLSTRYRDHLDLSCHGTANQSSISLAEILDYWVALPPAYEQQIVCESLTETLDNINQLINEGRKMIDLLDERRSALISAAVTGQIDVRGLVSEKEAA